MKEVIEEYNSLGNQFGALKIGFEVKEPKRRYGKK